MGEWRQNGVRAAEILDQVPRTLNSSEQFEMNDSFQLSFVHVRRPPVGTGMTMKYLPGYQSSQRFKQMKRTCVAMPQVDAQLCAARAIVTARGLHQAGNNPNERQKWTDPKRCVQRRDRAACALLGEVGLRPSPYGPEELTLLATAKIFTSFVWSLTVSSLFLFFKSSWWTPTGLTPVSPTDMERFPWTYCMRMIIWTP